MTHMKAALSAVAVAVMVSVPTAVSAFCGFYVGGAEAPLYNNATMVVMMRDGTRTVLSMQNNYEGPPSNFAMIVPVPVILQEENVKTLPRDVFVRVDRLAAPRLVEYWEQDPCNPHTFYDRMELSSVDADAPFSDDNGGGDYGVTVEAEFTVGEYDIVILSAKEATGLDRWLRAHKYNIPAGADKLLKPYVAGGMKFFVAKVDIKKVTFKDGQAMLSPLRFHYDSQQFNLPVRLGLVNSSGTQDLLVHILASERYEVANYKNITIPTNLNVSDETRKSFGTFYAALFDATLERHGPAVVTEYSWDASSCDPCPTPALTMEELLTLGADVIKDRNKSFVLTRLHARYGSDSLGDDLVFRTAEPIVGGRERMSESGVVERGAVADSINNFQGRYIIRHVWEGAIECEKPQRGIWGGPPGQGMAYQVEPAKDIAFAPRGGDISLTTYLRQDVDEIDYKVSQADKTKFKASGIQRKSSGCAGCATGGGVAGGGVLLVLLAMLWSRRRL